jgi:hypothetical protein
MVWTGSNWLRIRTSGGLLWTRQWTFGFHKMVGSSWVAAQLAASLEGLSSVRKYYWQLQLGGGSSSFTRTGVCHKMSAAYTAPRHTTKYNHHTHVTRRAEHKFASVLTARQPEPRVLPNFIWITQWNLGNANCPTVSPPPPNQHL